MSSFPSKTEDTEFLTFYHQLCRRINSELAARAAEVSHDGSTPPIADGAPDTIRLFEIVDNDYQAYRAYNNDAFYLADNISRTRSVVKYLGNKKFENHERGLPYVMLKSTLVQPFLKDALLHMGIKIEIYAKKDSAAVFLGEKYNSSNRDPWVLIRQASPGNLREVEDLLGNSVIDEDPVVISLKIQTKKVDSVGATLGGGGSGPSSGSSTTSRNVGICYIEATSRQIGIFEFVDNDLFSNLESVIIQLGVKECILPGRDSQEQPKGQTQEAHDMSKIVSLLERCDVAITFQKQSNFNTRDIEQDLSRLLSNTTTPISALSELSLSTAMAATAALIKYLDLMSQPDSFEKFSIVKHDLSQYMRLDSSAIKALNLMPPPGLGSIGSGPSSQNSNARSTSIFGLLNWCRSSAGTRLLGQWLKQPLMNLIEIRERHTLVGAFVNDSILRQTLHDDSLRTIPDIPRLIRKLHRGVATLEDCVRIYQMVIKIPEIFEALEAFDDDGQEVEDGSRPSKVLLDETYTLPLKIEYSKLEKLQELVETTIDLDALDRHEFVIRPAYDETLQEIRGRLDELRKSMAEEHLLVGEDLGMDPEKKLKLEQHNIQGWCFRLTRIEAKCLANKQGYTECSTQKNGVLFRSKALKEFAAEFQDLQKQYNDTQSGLVKEVIEIVSTYTPVLEVLSQILSHLDVMVALAQAAVNAPTQYVKPKMHPKGAGRTVLKDARHPCLETQDDMRFIPNDVNLVRGESEFLLVTGPNMGGKSTYIRQIGVICLMAQIGSFIPCSEEGCELTIVDSILARVGAGDSQLKGVSTFMAEMLETSTILKSATKDSLIVIDELGRGTSTYDGFGLAWAISDYIVKEIKCFGMFATHFHELTQLADLYPNAVKNLQVLAHVREVDAKIALETTHKSALNDNQKDSDIFSSPSIALLYKVEPGISDQSFGIHVAEVVQFPDKVVKMAKRKALELEDFDRDDTTKKAKVDEIASKYSTKEIHEGTEIMRSVLKQWAEEVGPLDEEALSKINSQDVLAKLSDVLEKSGFTEKISGNEFAKSIMAQL